MAVVRRKPQDAFGQFPSLRAQTEYEVPDSYSPEDRVYLLRDIYGDIRFGGPQWTGYGQRLTDIFRQVQTGRASIEEVARRWRTPRCTGRVSPWNDCPMVNNLFMTISRRAADVLRDLIEDQAVLLPLQLERRKYFCVVPRVSRRALDESGSIPSGELSWVAWSQPRYHRFSFRPEVVRPLALFSIPQEPCKTFATDRFVRRVIEHRLTGFNFQPVFPLQPKHRWDRIADRNLRAHLAEGRPKGASVWDAPVIVNFILDHPNRIPRPKEERLIKSWAQTVDRNLWNEQATDLPIGYLDRVAPDTGSCRVEFRGPDKGKLRSHLRKWIAEAQWPGPVRC